MSYDLYIVGDDGTTLRLKETTHDVRGGTYVLGGTSEARINITYNYTSWFQKALGKEGIDTLYGKKTADTTQLLLEAIGKLHGEPVDNYWEPAEGNVRKALIDCLSLALLFPDGTWTGD
jgi:hypothetical protein